MGNRSRVQLVHVAAAEFNARRVRKGVSLAAHGLNGLPGLIQQVRALSPLPGLASGTALEHHADLPLQDARRAAAPGGHRPRGDACPAVRLKQLMPLVVAQFLGLRIGHLTKVREST